MNKKQRNRKLVTQNKRNRMINRRYSSTIKTLSKLFLKKVSTVLSLTKEEGQTSNGKSEEKSKVKSETKNIVNKVYSIIDKAVKKGVIHKNTAARKKSRIGKMFIKM